MGLFPRRRDAEGPRGVHVPKGRRRNKAVEVKFDPAQHKEYLTGFRKRKDQRRKRAAKALERKAREEKAQFQKDKRARLLAQLRKSGFDANGEKAEAEGEADAEGEAGAGPQEVEEKIFSSGKLKSVVTVGPLAGFESESGSDGSDDE